MKLQTTIESTMFAIIAALAVMILSSGCSLVPETRQRDVIHNPFPQLKRVAVLPFYNQSNEPTVDTGLVSEEYYAALQAIPGFEVLPIGVAKAQWLQYSMQYGEPTSGADFQRLAQTMGVEAIVVGSVTDFNAFYPPRMAMTVHWYAANEGFHTIPAGYGLPWGTDAEKQIPRRIAREAEFELARSQLETQSPVPSPPAVVPTSAEMELGDPGEFYVGDTIMDDYSGSADGFVINGVISDGVIANGVIGDENVFAMDEMEAPMPPNWPNPTDLIPDPPSPVRPVSIASHEPVLSHTRIYRGDDPYFTKRLSDFVETGDDARSSGWQGYLKRSDDFIHFCCHLHITEMLESRGGADQRDLILRWPLSRY